MVFEESAASLLGLGCSKGKERRDAGSCELLKRWTRKKSRLGLLKLGDQFELKLRRLDRALRVTVNRA